MARLVYSPRAYVFVKDQNGNIHNLTNYVTAGSVKRLTDQVSSAEVTFRNPNSLFTVHVKNGEVIPPKFLPMDPITIYLRRVNKRPVRVFTGFLDRVPYLQLYPGTVTMQASCTLKRLVHTYFDPALPYTMSFLTTYGWVPYNGQWVSLTGMKEWLPPGTAPTDKNANMAAPNPVGKGSKNVYVIGDSLAVGTQTPLAKALPGYNITTSARIGRTTAQGIAVLKNYQASGTLPETIVVSLGSNDDVTDTTTFKSRVKELMDLAGNKRHVIWFTLHGTNLTGSLANLNPVLKAVKQDYPNMTVVDWDAAVTADDVGLDSSQHIHPNTAGYTKRASLAADAIRAGALDGGSGNKLQPPKDVDGSLSQLLYATLKHIGSWNTKDIYIEAMPEDLFKRMADLANEFIQDNKEARAEFEQLLSRIAGSGSYGTSGTSVDLSGINGDVPEVVYKVGIKMGVQANSKLMLSAMETGLVEAPIDSGKSFGNPKGGDLTGVPGAPTSRQSSGWRQETVSAYPNVDRNNVTESAQRYFNEGKALMEHKTVGKAGTGSYQDSWSAGELAQAIQGSAFPDRYDAVRSTAEALLSKIGNKISSDPSLGPQTDLGTLPPPDKTVRANDGTNKSATTQDTTSPAPGIKASAVSQPGSGGGYGDPRSYGSHAGVDISMPEGTKLVACCKGTVAYAGETWYPGPKGHGMISIRSSEKVGSFAAGTVFGYGHSDVHYKKVGDKVEPGDLIGLSGAPSGGPHLHFFINTAGVAGGNGNTNPTDFVTSLINGSQIPTNDTPSSDPAVSDNVASQAAAGAFFAALDLPGALDVTEAVMLGGEKSLMNDKPLLPFIQQLCSASLRHFQSLPDGRFYAFYPDYFGEMEHHPPYWEIDDIEVLDGKVELTDDPLVTHSYAVGDTVAPMANSDTPFAIRAASASGVVTIFNAFMANGLLDRTKSRQKDKQKAERAAKTHPQNKSNKKKKDKTVSNPEGMGIILDRNEAANFLERYGARPYTDDVPMIKSPYFEMFLAYQNFLLAWSKQFSTPFSFTFMPELFPGGKVGFPKHGLQMYIESVEHSWDYESGFTTSASLTAPSEYGSNTGLLPPNMVQAIIEPATKKSVSSE
jgi:murein DD-endopeptidase MepM/ murein hydrolase activator NlpD